ncbi:hypothetical protein AAII07_31890 [Microvirga sp. 0TCS3.31]
MRGEIRTTTLTVGPGQAYMRHDDEGLDRPAQCAVYRDGNVVLVDEAEGCCAVRRNRDQGPWRRAEAKRQVEEARHAREVMARSKYGR